MNRGTLKKEFSGTPPLCSTVFVYLLSWGLSVPPELEVWGLKETVTARFHADSLSRLGFNTEPPPGTQSRHIFQMVAPQGVAGPEPPPLTSHPLLELREPPRETAGSVENKTLPAPRRRLTTQGRPRLLLGMALGPRRCFLPPAFWKIARAQPSGNSLSLSQMSCVLFPHPCSGIMLSDTLPGYQICVILS